LPWYLNSTPIFTWPGSWANERLSEVKSQLQEGIEPEMGPIATSMGEIFMHTVNSVDGADHDPMHLRAMQDWTIRPQLRQTPGVVEINTILMATLNSFMHYQLWKSCSLAN